MRRTEAAVAPLVTIAVALLLWQLAVEWTGVRAYLVPSPWQVARALVAERASLLAATARTATAAVAGFSLAALIGVLSGTVLASIPALRRGVYPLANLLQMVPLVAVAPLLTIWFGYGLRAVIASATLVAVFPVIANTVDGLRSVDPRLRELFRIYGASATATWWRLELPSATPHIVTGLRIAAGLAVIGTIVGEFVSGYIGDRAPIGIVILVAIREAQTALVFAAVLLSASVGFVLFGVVSAAGHWALRRWHPSEK